MPLMRPMEELDATGLLCPLPVLKLRKRIRPMAVGEAIMMTCDDPAAIVDVPHFCAEQGHRILRENHRGDLLSFVIEKSGVTSK